MAGGRRGHRHGCWFGLPFGRRCQRAAADDEVTGFNVRGHRDLAGTQAMQGQFDQIPGGFGVAAFADLQRLLVLPTAEAEANVEDAVFLAEVGHGGCSV